MYFLYIMISWICCKFILFAQRSDFRKTTKQQLHSSCVLCVRHAYGTHTTRILRYKGFRLFDEDILDSEAEKRGAQRISQVGGVNLAEKFGKVLERISLRSQRKAFIYWILEIPNTRPRTEFHGFSLFRQPVASNMLKIWKKYSSDFKSLCIKAVEC